MIYKAFRTTPKGKRRSIITVTAENDADARKEIRRQLDRPGRRHYYRAWLESGQIVERQEKENV